MSGALPRILLVAALVYAGICAAVWIGQAKLLYFPSTTPAGLVAARAARMGLEPWPGPHEAYRGLASIEPADARGTVVVFHGNAGSALDRGYYLAPLEALGWRVVLAEYPGYGPREGRLGETSFAEDAAATLRAARAAWGGPVVAWGESLGAGVVGSAVRRLVESGEPPDGVVLLTPWNTLPALAQVHYPWLPARLLVRDHFDTAANLAAYEGRVAVVAAERDEIIPPRLTDALVETLAPETRSWTLAGAGHNSWPAGPDEAWWGEVLGWVAAEDAGGPPDAARAPGGRSPATP